MRKSNLTIAFLLLFPALSATAFSPLIEGEKLFMANKPSEALPLIEEALNADPQNEKIYLYLGIIYEQLSQSEKAIAIMQRGLEVADKTKDLLYFNIGNGFFKQGDNTLAEDMFSKAIVHNAGFAAPYLNRANVRLNQKNYSDALNDYIIFLRLEPESRQKPEIERVIALLKEFLAEQIEMEREQKAQEQEKKAREQALMNEVLNSLKNASEDAQNLSTGSKDILAEEEGEIDILD